VCQVANAYSGSFDALRKILQHDSWFKKRRINQRAKDYWWENGRQWKAAKKQHINIIQYQFRIGAA